MERMSKAAAKLQCPAAHRFRTTRVGESARGPERGLGAAGNANSL